MRRNHAGQIVAGEPEKARVRQERDSRSPGEQQCPWVVDRVAAIYERAAASAQQAIDASKPREHHGRVVSVGGMSIEPLETGRQRIVKHLTVKYGRGGIVK
jgi:hypothetical protein